MTHYSATSLEQIADEIRRLRMAHTYGHCEDDDPSDIRADFAAAAAYETAEALVRNTRLADPAMEAMVKALEVMLAVHDMQQAPAGDRIAAWASAVTAASAALNLAKDNGHV